MNVLWIDILLIISFSTLKPPIQTTIIGTSPAEYFFIRICILFLHNIAPISTLYCIQLLLAQFFHLPTYVEIIPYLVQIWLTAEAIFFTAVSIPIKYALDRSPFYHRYISTACREQLFESCHTNVQIWRDILAGGLWSQRLNISDAIT
ncbi:hypothetical protein ASPFODRAFT_459873 [Aspergillus luchuensis CBS 106.47]|uniref:Uncharacterized protein n=1 Tax=Aspergillus luchuensis (strain CBS 106.47) TaxID=1137211 RepID=A0A1M3T0P3_ASPLC|nr:hypothetical protein ASPFODRAFT_459873 [Aspergillus luchuensis CBS 106.47]